MAEHKHWKSEFPSDYFGSQHMPADGSDMIVTIKEAGTEAIRSSHGTEQKLVLTITADPDKWIINKTNGKMIAKVLETDFLDEWVGKKVQLYVTKVASPEGLVDAVRVREFAPQS